MAPGPPATASSAGAIHLSASRSFLGRESSEVGVAVSKTLEGVPHLEMATVSSQRQACGAPKRAAEMKRRDADVLGKVTQPTIRIDIEQLTDLIRQNLRSRGTLKSLIP